MTVSDKHDKYYFLGGHIIYFSTVLRFLSKNKKHKQETHLKYIYINHISYSFDILSVKIPGV